jgi:predicted component of type VI protein secretion system
VLAGSPAEEAGEDEATLMVRPVANRPRFAVRHEQPPGHSGATTLTRDAYLIGRSPSSDLRLFSPNASREHARLSLRSGAWYLAPCEGKTVIVNGETVRAEVRLTHKMRLVLGEDELLVIDQAAPVEPAAAPAAVAAAGGTGAPRWIIVAIVAAVVIAAAVVWVLSRG